MLSDDALYQEIFDAIIARRLPPGSKLTEATLCEIFGVKRNTVRKALAQLAAKKMVDLHFNRGAYVASPTEEEARDIFEVRRVREAYLVATLAARPVRPDLSAIRDGVRQERDSFLHQDFPGWIRRSLDFHTHLVRLSGNQVMADYVEDLVYRAPLISALYDFATSSPSRVPFTDLYDTVSGSQTGFQARPVVGGIFALLSLDH